MTAFQEYKHLMSNNTVLAILFGIIGISALVADDTKITNKVEYVTYSGRNMGSGRELSMFGIAMFMTLAFIILMLLVLVPFIVLIEFYITGYKRVQNLEDYSFEEYRKKALIMGILYFPFMYGIFLLSNYIDSSVSTLLLIIYPAISLALPYFYVKNKISDIENSIAKDEPTVVPQYEETSQFIEAIESVDSPILEAKETPILETTIVLAPERHTLLQDFFKKNDVAGGERNKAIIVFFKNRQLYVENVLLQDYFKSNNVPSEDRNMTIVELFKSKRLYIKENQQ